ncbi:hypothetical protein vseg_011519 [Gypsophila vaccaria]
MSAALARNHPPGFDGTGGPAALEECIRNFGKLFTTVGCPDSLRVYQATCYLKGHADLWWYTNQDELKLYHNADTNQEEEFECASFKKTIRAEFFPKHLCHPKRTEYKSFRQSDGMSAEEYYTHFMEVSSYSSDLMMSNKILAA